MRKGPFLPEENTQLVSFVNAVGESLGGMAQRTLLTMVVDARLLGELTRTELTAIANEGEG